jgi:lysophospholipase L1-like esterase
VVELYRDTEGMYGLSTFLGFTSGTVKGAPAASGRLIEVVGDSISAGYGDLGSEPHPNWVASPACHWTADNSTWYLSYAAVAGHALNAEVSTIARSGWGMYRDNSGSTTGVLSSVYANALGTDNTAVWGFVPKASVVVINLGTNDWATGDPGTPYETAYKSFITKVRSHYPDAWIFLTIGSMLGDPALSQVKTRLANVVAAFTATGDQKLATFDLGTQNMGADGSVPTGCDWHPNVADHLRMAGILQLQLSAKLGWQVP